MGYTHYWRQLRDFTDTEWQELTRLTKLITADGGDVLDYITCDVDPTPKDKMDTDWLYTGCIAFNGIGDDEHETFIITKKKRAKREYEEQEDYDRQGAFGFCKTAHKPYDKYVVAVLCAIYRVQRDIMNISSDGNTADWTEGLFHAVHSTREEEMYCPIRDCLTLSFVDYIDQKEKTG